MAKKKFTATEISKILHSTFSPLDRYVISNAYLFSSDWESDFFTVKNQSGYCYEYEIKVSRADFKADFKKVKKHSIIEKGEYTDSRGRKHPHIRRPNRFYYVVPENLGLTLSDIPSYAGLFTVSENGGLVGVKNAPLLHKNVVDYSQALCQKYYFHASNLRYDNWKLQEENQRLLRRYKHHDIEKVTKYTKSKLNDIITEMSYGDYFTFIIKFIDYGEMEEKFKSLGFVQAKSEITAPTDETEVKSSYTGRLFKYYRTLSDTHRPLTENEFMELKNFNEFG